MFKSRFIQRFIFDIILVSIFFLPLFTAIFLWNVFFNGQPDTLPVSSRMPQFDEAKFTAVTRSLSARRHLTPMKPKNIGNAIFDNKDPFGP